MRTTFLAIAAATAALATVPALAERADRAKEIVIVADKGTGDDANKVTTFTGNVVVTQGTMRITAEKLTVREDAQGYKFYVASGSPVTFRQKRDKVEEYIDGEAQRAEFDDKADLLKLFTKARVKSGANQIAGEFISYDVQKELAEAAGAPPGVQAPKDSRVKVIILPPKKGEAEKNPPVKLKPDEAVK